MTPQTPQEHARCDIVGISLPNNGLTGRLDPTLCSLTQLQLFDISRNDVSGVLPNAESRVCMQQLEVLDPVANVLQTDGRKRASWPWIDEDAVAVDLLRRVPDVECREHAAVDAFHSEDGVVPTPSVNRPVADAKQSGRLDTAARKPRASLTASL